MVPSNFPGASHFWRPRSNTFPWGQFLIVLLLWVVICVISRQPGALALPQFLVLSAIMMLCTAWALWGFYQRQRYIDFRWILLSAVVLRLVSLIGEPLFEDDYWRYLWDGFQTATTHDPYTLAPEYFFDVDVPELFEPVLSLINYPNVATVYGPVSQWLFAVGYWLAPAEIWPLQLLAGLADLLVLVMLYRLGAGNALLLYAWSPLLLKEFSLTAHPDIYAVLGMMISVYAVYKNRALVAGVALALAVGSKVFAILALPYLLTRARSVSLWLWFSVGFVGSLALITAAFGSLRIWVPEGLVAMADSWLFNAPLYLLAVGFIDFTLTKWLLLLLFVLYGGISCLRRLLRPAETRHGTTGGSIESHQWVHSRAAFRGDWLFGLFLLCLPVLNPWYVAWLLPFAVLYPRWWSWTASYAVLLSYWYGVYIGGASEHPPLTVVVLEYSLIVLVALTAFVAKLVYRR